MTPNKDCYDLIKKFEGFRSEAYQDQAGVWTIGYGNTYYPNGDQVKKGQTLPEDEASSLLEYWVDVTASGISRFIKSTLNQNQFNALTSFAYNTGIGALKVSTLLSMINSDPNDKDIRYAFLMWDKIHVDGKLVENEGLKNRRRQEADLYFSPA